MKPAIHDRKHTSRHLKARRPMRAGRPGFALVVSLTLLLLLTMLAIGMLGLASITLRSSAADAGMSQARQQARLALMLAIGELQAATGPDQRITAPADIRGGKPAQPHITGVWKGWKWDGTGNAPDFAARKDADFLRWLVSTRDPQSAIRLDTAGSAPAGQVARLVRSSHQPEDHVDAEIIRTSGRDGASAGLAWAVFDESTKLPIGLPEDTRTDNDSANRLAAMTAAPHPGYAASTRRDWAPIDTLGPDREKLITPAAAALASVAPADRGFHDLTSTTAGVLANVAEGGLAMDLSRLFDGPELPADYSSRYIYSDDSTPLAPVPPRFNGANPFPSADPSWRLLHSHYRMFDQLRSGSGGAFLETTSLARPRAGTRGRAIQEHPFFHSQQIAPVIAKAQFVFSLSFGWHPSLPNFARTNNNSLPEAQRDQYITWLVVDPVITLWNPYNVPIRFQGGRIDLYRVPLAFRLYKNGTLINPQYTHLANTFVQAGDFTSRSNTYYRLNLLPEAGKREILLAPGEFLVLSAHNHARHYRFQFQEKGLDLRPGFHPPAGNASSATVGGVSTMNVCVSPTGQASGMDYGRTVRSVAVKPGDVIQIEVRPEAASVDRPAETGGREISGFLKYYAGDPANPNLIGGIELDYQGREREYLESYERRDLPTLVVRNDIPRQLKADDDPPNSAAVVLRFKEPFLISSFQLKTERDSKFPSRGWLHNSPVNLYASAGLDQRQAWDNHQYEFQWEAMTDWPPASPTIEISAAGNRGYGGSGIYAQSGVEFATHSSVPFAPALSLAQLKHAPLNVGGQLPLTSQIVANSFAPPVLPPNATISGAAGSATLFDHSYLANARLFDAHFFSGLATPGGPLGSGQPAVPSAITALFDSGRPLANLRFVPHRGGRSPAEILALLTAPDGHLKSAAHLLVNSPFNVNSTRVDVWEAVLASTFGRHIPTSDGNTAAGSAAGAVAASRHLPSPGGDFESAPSPLARDLAKWNGHRSLNPDEIRRLAEEIVVEVRTRGPFQSLAEFINRQPGDGPTALHGPLQAAIERSGINQNVLDPAHATPDGRSNTADGAPGVLSQADLLTPLAPVLATRGDTFRIRAYGESISANGRVHRAWCEAVVQRFPEYLDPSDPPWSTPNSPINTTFGRAYHIIGFRWLNQNEV